MIKTNFSPSVRRGYIILIITTDSHTRTIDVATHKSAESKPRVARDECSVSLGPHGGSLPRDGLEPVLDARNGAPRPARLALEEEQPEVLLEERVRTPARVARHVLLDVPPQHVLDLLLLEPPCNHHNNHLITRVQVRLNLPVKPKF